MMMISSSCVGGCLDAQDPVKVSFVRLYKWPEADAEFLRNLSMKYEKTSSETTGLRRHSPFNTSGAYVYHESFASRQRYLRSYTFSKKETLTEKTKRWLKEKQKAVLVKSTKCKNKLSHGSINGSCNSFLGGVFNVLLFCVATLDVGDDHDQ
ncbi:uncharacterized protein LOC121247004 [Juglans microcarpa x Juglans regia]|uniref:uncharacterized protein LOC121247004 n=1 Tax=Juglans microcarpa x Juglans regia TaxID=2249226 RepID=UPI001B7F1AD9|nr:uncharacterized protein LOC121247004 [Juglans microcarpa x Juglans regia]